MVVYLSRHYILKGKRHVRFEYLSLKNISRISDQNGVSLLYIMLEIHHSGGEPSIFDDILCPKKCWKYLEIFTNFLTVSVGSGESKRETE